MSEACKHMNFYASVKVIRMEDSGQFMADVSIQCEDCKIPMQFLGLEPGLNLHGATVSIDGLEARLAICPEGARPNPIQKLMGHSVKGHN